MRAIKKTTIWIFAGMLLAFSLLLWPMVVKAAESGDYQYRVLTDGTAEISHYSGTTTDLSIPGDIDGYQVTSIGSFAFDGCVSLFNVTIPESVTSLGNYAFNGCKNLKSITLPEGMTGIPAGAFDNCSSLTSITIPDDVTSIGQYAFYGCSSLTNIELPEGVTSIGTAAFNNCNSLTSISIPEGVTSIGENTFWGCSSLTSITLSENVTSIGNGAFRSCENLTSIKLPEGLTSIGNNAFYSCYELTNISIPEGVTSIGDRAFNNCISLTKITIPGSVQSIGTDAFRYLPNTYVVYTIPGTYAAQYFDPSHVQYLYEEEPVSDYLGFTTDRIILAPNGTVVLSDYLNTNLELSNLSVAVSDNNLFVYANEQITAQGEGTGSLTVSYGELSATVSLIATATSVDTTEITLDSSELRMKKGQSELLRVTFGPEGATDTAITWSSSDASVATVNNGNVTAVGSGTAIITATLSSNEEVKAVCRVTVTNPLKAIITLEEAQAYTLQTGQSMEIPYYLYPSDAEDVEMTFVSSDPDIISIDENGKLTAHEEGTVQITLSSGNISKTVDVTAIFIRIPLTGLSLEQTSVNAACGEKIQLVPVFEPKNTTDRNVSWSTDREYVASVDENGLVEVYDIGSATITVSFGSFSATCEIICNQHTWDEGRITVEPTCTEDGEKVFSCICGVEYTEVIPAHHTWNDAYTVDKVATCTEEGSQSIHCSICDTIKEDSVQVIEKAAHDWGEWIVTIPATPFSEGEEIRKCNHCDAEETQSIPAIGPRFDDVQNPAAWYYETVYTIANTVNANGKPLMSGYSGANAGKFGPADPLTRQDFAVILHRLADEPEVPDMENPFKDTSPSGYYYTCVLWAKANGVIAGYNDGRFGVGDKITREQVATILYRFASEYAGIDTSEALAKGDLSHFNDGTAISGWAEEALTWATGAGVITGKDNGTRIDARDNAARAEIGAMILRFISYLEDAQ